MLHILRYQFSAPYSMYLHVSVDIFFIQRPIIEESPEMNFQLLSNIIHNNKWA